MNYFLAIFSWSILGAIIGQIVCFIDLRYIQTPIILQILCCRYNFSSKAIIGSFNDGKTGYTVNSGSNGSIKLYGEWNWLTIFILKVMSDIEIDRDS